MSDAFAQAMVSSSANGSLDVFNKIRRDVEGRAFVGAYHLDYKCTDIPGVQITRVVQLFIHSGYQAKYSATTDTLHISWHLHEVKP